MTFASTSANKEQLRLLSQWLLAAFPGCTIHQSRDPMRAMQQISSGKIDAVFADADTCSACVHIFKKHKSNPAIYLLCRQDTQPPEDTGGIRGRVTDPTTKQKIQIALQGIPWEIREVV